MSFQRVLETAGFTKVELAVLYGVSRQTIHAWAKDSAARDGSYLARMAAVITRALLLAVQKRILPLGPLAREARVARVAKMAKTLQDMKPDPR